MAYSWTPVIPGMNDNRAAYGHKDMGTPTGVRNGSNIWAMIWYDDAPKPTPAVPDPAPSQYSYQVEVPYEYYADVETTESVDGALCAQTLLMPRAGWAVQLGLYYTQVGPVGDVEVLVTRCVGGKPDPQQVISKVTLAQSAMKKYPLETVVPIPPCMVMAGERIGLIEISQGNHFIAMGDNGYTEGTFFKGTSGGDYLQGDILKDRKCKVYVANFASPRTEVMLQNVSLAGGITDIAIKTEQPQLDGATLHYEAQIAGIWKPLTGNSLGALAGTPDIVPLRAVWTGTADIQCGLQLGAGRVKASRPAVSSTVTSELITVSSKRYFTVDLVVNRWDAAKNTVVGKLLTGAGYTTETASTTAVVSNEGTMRGWKRIRFTFDVGSAVTSFKFKSTVTRASDGLPVRRMERTSVATG